MQKDIKVICLSNGKQGLEVDGKEVLAPKYDKVKAYQNSVITKSDNIYTSFDLDGNFLFKTTDGYECDVWVHQIRKTAYGKNTVELHRSILDNIGMIKKQINDEISEFVTGEVSYLVKTMADEAYTSHNTRRLNVEETAKKILTASYVKEEFMRWKK